MENGSLHGAASGCSRRSMLSVTPIRTALSLCPAQNEETVPLTALVTSCIDRPSDWPP
jgi:hypothetical protein